VSVYVISKGDNIHTVSSIHPFYTSTMLDIMIHVSNDFDTREIMMN
jgi:hypothetical protein